MANEHKNKLHIEEKTFVCIVMLLDKRTLPMECMTYSSSWTYLKIEILSAKCLCQGFLRSD